jgi:hypothetical protein
MWQECSVCRKKTRIFDGVTFPCGDHFCPGCLNTWFKTVCGSKSTSRLSAANKRSTKRRRRRCSSSRNNNLFIRRRNSSLKQRLRDEFAAMAVQYLLLHTLFLLGFKDMQSPLARLQEHLSSLSTQLSRIGNIWQGDIYCRHWRILNVAEKEICTTSVLLTESLGR